jgi:hypothetical protein
MTKYNTTGTLTGQPASSNKAAEAANPPLSAVDALQLLLDLAGLIPGAGAVPDLINAVISFIRGDFIGGLFSVFSAVPAVGDAAGLAKIIKNSDRHVQAIKVVETKVLPKLPDFIRKPLQEFIAKAKAKMDELTDAKPKPEAKPDAPGQGNNGGGNNQNNSQVRRLGKCILRPYKPDTCKAEGKTGHHVVPDRAFRLGERTGANRDQIPGGVSEGEGLVICVEGATPTPTNQHGKIHKAYNAAEKIIGLAGDPKGTAPLAALEAAGAAAAAKETGCNAAKLMALLRAYH